MPLWLELPLEDPECDGVADSVPLTLMLEVGDAEDVIDSVPLWLELPLEDGEWEGVSDSVALLLELEEVVIVSVVLGVPLGLELAEAVVDSVPL